MKLTRNIVTFASVVHLLDKSGVRVCSDLEYKLAIDKHIKHNLRYNIKTGITRDDELGELARFSSATDIPNYSTAEEVLQWELLPFINDSISRLQRGYDA